MIVCHVGYHRGIIKLNIRRGQSYRDAAFMNTMKWTFYNRLKEIYQNVEMTYGYITKSVRIENKFPKTHCIDAYCITGNISAELLDYYFYQKQVRKTNRQIHKANIIKGGRRKLNQAQKYVKGYQLYDKVKYNGKSYYVFGRRTSGYFDIRTLSGEKINKGSISHKKLKKLETRKNILVERRGRSPLMTEVASIRTA